MGGDSRSSLCGELSEVILIVTAVQKVMVEPEIICN